MASPNASSFPSPKKWSPPDRRAKQSKNTKRILQIFSPLSLKCARLPNTVPKGERQSVRPPLQKRYTRAAACNPTMNEHAASSCRIMYALTALISSFGNIGVRKEPKTALTSSGRRPNRAPIRTFPPGQKQDIASRNDVRVGHSIIWLLDCGPLLVGGDGSLAYLSFPPPLTDRSIFCTAAALLFHWVLTLYCSLSLARSCLCGCVSFVARASVCRMRARANAFASSVMGA